MFIEATQPRISSLIQDLLMDQGDLRIRELGVGSNGLILGKKLGEQDLRAHTNVLIAAARTEVGQPFAYNPGPDLVFQSKMILIVLGPEADLAKFEGMV
jgi:Trk K+ transport system NAD-binding subunit